jgi:hypothetical protein
VSLRRSGPGRPEPVSRNALHPLPWRFSRVGADRVPVGRSQGFDASRLAPVRGCGCRSRAGRRVKLGRLPGRKWTCTSSPQAVGGPRAGETGGGSSGSPRCVRTFRINPGSRTGCPQQPEVANSAKARDGFALVKQSERDEPDVTAAPRARKRKLLPHPGHQFRPGNSRGVVRAGLCMSVAAAFHGMSADSPAGGLPAGGGVAPPANVPISPAT